MFYRHDIDIEDDDSIDFEDLLKKALVLIRCRKRISDFIKEEESDWKLTNHRKDQPTAQMNHDSVPPIVLPPTSTSPDIVEPDTYKTPGLTLNVRAIQWGVQVPVARIHTSRGNEVKVDEVNLDDDDRIFVPTPPNIFMKTGVHYSWNSSLVTRKLCSFT